MKKLFSTCLLLCLVGCLSPDTKYKAVQAEYFDTTVYYTIQGIELDPDITDLRRRALLDRVTAQRIHLKASGSFEAWKEVEGK